MPHLVGIWIMFVCRAVCVVIRGVPVDEPVKEQRIKGEPPVRGRRMVLVTGPFSPVVERIHCGLVLIEVVLRKGRIVSQCPAIGNEE